MLKKSLISLALLAAGALAQADTLLLDGLNVAAASVSVRPERGSSMATVESRYGEPSERSEPIGDPPITRWEYPEFTVFFEYEHVIHAVVRH